MTVFVFTSCDDCGLYLTPHTTVTSHSTSALCTAVLPTLVLWPLLTGNDHSVDQSCDQFDWRQTLRAYSGRKISDLFFFPVSPHIYLGSLWRFWSSCWEEAITNNLIFLIFRNLLPTEATIISGPLLFEQMLRYGTRGICDFKKKTKSRTHDIWKQIATNISSAWRLWRLSIIRQRATTTRSGSNYPVWEFSHILISWFPLQCFPQAGFDWNHL